MRCDRQTSLEASGFECEWDDTFQTSSGHLFVFFLFFLISMGSEISPVKPRQLIHLF